MWTILDLKVGDRLLSIRGSNLAFVMGEKVRCRNGQPTDQVIEISELIIFIYLVGEHFSLQNNAPVRSEMMQILPPIKENLEPTSGSN
jgi:hypothetical protein